MREIAFHPDVRVEIQDAFDWYNKNATGLGEEFLKELDNAFELVSGKPMMWAEYSKGFRRYLLKRFPFGIIYKPEKDNIYIVAIMHLSRKPGYWKNRV